MKLNQQILTRTVLIESTTNLTSETTTQIFLNISFINNNQLFQKGISDSNTTM